ncbi:MAG: NAD(P)H-dependent oxidoreductase [Sandaracinaceae bacterium]
MERVLLLFAHPVFERSRVNRSLLEAARGVSGVDIHDLYELYPEFDVDVRAEQEALLAHDVVVFQHPFYWYSAPALVKQWLDLVLEHGWAYGHGGDALHGKRLAQALTTGGRDDAYGPGGYNRYSMEEFLRPFEQTARLCGMTYEPPFVVHGTHRIGEAGLIEAAGRYVAYLTALRDGRAARSDGPDAGASAPAPDARG